MGYKIVKLQNKSNWDKEKPTICISIDDPEWEEAYKNWQEGKNPTNSPEWKKGIVAITELIKEK